MEMHPLVIFVNSWEAAATAVAVTGATAVATHIHLLGAIHPPQK